MIAKRKNKAEHSRPPSISYATLRYTDEEILGLFRPSVRKWWVDTFGPQRQVNKGYFTPPQRLAIPLIHEGKNVLICSPTGSGKTLSAFTAIINELFLLANSEEGLENSVYCIYISPLKSLANDIHKNLEEPLTTISKYYGEEALIRHAIRHGDTASEERSSMLRKAPHILNTTPETLAILLNTPKFSEKLRTVRWVIVDEIHSMADTKRGVFLSLCLERLEEIVKAPFVRIGCSATVEPLDKIAQFLGGNVDGVDREVTIVDTRFVRDYELKLLCPVPDLINTPPQEVNRRLYEMIHELVQEHNNTLIFTNTRSGAERILYHLRKAYPEFYNEENSGCHHGSLGKDGRLGIEDMLKSGKAKVVTTSTSLELGIDMPYLDMVIQVGSPKSVSALLQRIGRAGHRLGQTVKGRVIALDRDELIECAVMLKKAQEGFIDAVHIPENCLDVLAQHVYGMAINEPIDVEKAKKIVRRSYCYRSLSDEGFMSVIRYLAGGLPGMEEKGIYGKIWYDEETHKIGRRGKLARMIYYTNIGVIPDEFKCDVITRGDHVWVGSLDEQYLEKLQKGDVFVLGGKFYEFLYRRGSKVYVDPSTSRPTVPSWYSERLPLSFDLALHVLDFKEQMAKRTGDRSTYRWLLESYPIDENSAASIYQLFDEQAKYAKAESISTRKRLVIEEHLDREHYRRYYYFHSLYGRPFNDGLSRIMAYIVSREKTSNVALSVSDHGFFLSVPLSKKLDIVSYLKSLDETLAKELLRYSLEESQLLKRMFRINATRSLMILRNYKGHQKSARRQQVSADMLLSYAHRLEGFAVLEEAYREIIEDKLEIGHIQEVVRGIKRGEIDIKLISVESPSPLAFGIATLSASDVVLAEDKASLLKEFHKRVMEKIGKGK
ncbi:ATP-dependent helicase [Methanocella conradii]|uniref:ATP-dependent helicase n=1 Tax=Methanocella conradii TaxID=1175444 RepID=UPI0024B32254|nr:ATP-dependent helicase [Methanocella conradii]MDI6897829.1 ATP-dependent helicase [Methanocella conradii]